MRLLLLVASYLLLATSCTLQRDVPPATAGPLDSLVRAKVGLSTGKVKFNGPVTFQLGGSGNTATAAVMPRATAPALATAPGATAGATTRTGVPTWQLVAGGVLLLLLLLAGLAYKFRARFLNIST